MDNKERVRRNLDIVEIDEYRDSHYVSTEKDQSCIRGSIFIFAAFGIFTMCALMFKGRTGSDVHSVPVAASNIVTDSFVISSVVPSISSESKLSSVSSLEKVSVSRMLVQSIFEEGVLEALAATLPCSILISINSLVSENDQRIAAYLSANVVLDAIDLAPIIDDDNSTSIDDIADVRDHSMRATECAHFVTDFDHSSAGNIIAASIFASIQSEVDAIAYLEYSGFGDNTVTEVTADRAAWFDSCLELIALYRTTWHRDLSGRVNDCPVEPTPTPLLIEPTPLPSPGPADPAWSRTRSLREKNSWIKTDIVEKVVSRNLQIGGESMDDFHYDDHNNQTDTSTPAHDDTVDDAVDDAVDDTPVDIQLIATEEVTVDDTVWREPDPAEFEFCNENGDDDNIIDLYYINGIDALEHQNRDGAAELKLLLDEIVPSSRQVRVFHVNVASVGLVNILYTLFAAAVPITGIVFDRADILRYVLSYDLTTVIGIKNNLKHCQTLIKSYLMPK